MGKLAGIALSVLLLSLIGMPTSTVIKPANAAFNSCTASITPTEGLAPLTVEVFNIQGSFPDYWSSGTVSFYLVLNGVEEYRIADAPQSGSSTDAFSMSFTFNNSGDYSVFIKCIHSSGSESSRYVTNVKVIGGSSGGGGGGTVTPPSDSDWDNDGFIDSIDSCMYDPEDYLGIEDGCPETDRDGDGIPDNYDACPDDQEDYLGIEEGCPEEEEEDTDGDRIFDGEDACPDVKEDYLGMLDGCPEPDLDHDGFIDSIDSCMHDPEDYLGIEDGCPETDSDSDGIPDHKDACPFDVEDYVGADENFFSLIGDGCPVLPGKPNSGCLIATATYGSELAPQVQFLREIRDNTVMSTASGTSFMSAFNTFYYSFSPTIADLERQNPIFKEAVKVTITPLLSTLSLLQYVDIDSESEMLGYGIGIILLNVGMYFVGPVLLIRIINSKKYRIKQN